MHDVKRAVATFSTTYNIDKDLHMHVSVCLHVRFALNFTYLPACLPTSTQAHIKRTELTSLHRL